MKEEMILKEPLLENLKNGDIEAFNAMIYLYRRKLLFESYYILSDMEEAEDVVQEVLVSFWRVKSNLANDSSLPNYLSRAVRNESYIKAKKNEVRAKKEKKFNYFHRSASFTDPAENAELGQYIMLAIKSLPPSQREDFIALYLEGKTQKNIALEQKKSLQTVKNSVHKALKNLRLKLSLFVE